MTPEQMQRAESVVKRLLVLVAETEASVEIVPRGRVWTTCSIQIGDGEARLECSEARGSGSPRNRGARRLRFSVDGVRSKTDYRAVLRTYSVVEKTAESGFSSTQIAKLARAIIERAREDAAQRQARKRHNAREHAARAERDALQREFPHARIALIDGKLELRVTGSQEELAAVLRCVERAKQ